MNVVACRRTPQGSEPFPTYPLSELREVLSRADWVVSALPLTFDTRAIFNHDMLSTMKKGSYFINVGRGELVDEASLITLLHSGHLGGAALDVFEVEPLPVESPLWTMPNVIITPHNSANTPGSHHRAALLFVENVRRRALGQQLLNIVEP
jgi:phosphoglycerate dehydrogenase-like enzyme